MPITSKKIDYEGLSKSCGYDKCYIANSLDELNKSLNTIKESKGLFMIVICCEISSRKDLGRPSISPKESLKNFIEKI